MKRGSIRPEAWEQATTRREQGIVSSILHAESEANGWADRAFSHLATYAGQKERPFTVEEFRAWAERAGLDAPPDHRAFGGVTQRAIRRGVLKRVGFAPTVSSNGSPRALYVGAIGERVRGTING